MVEMPFLGNISFRIVPSDEVIIPTMLRTADEDVSVRTVWLLRYVNVRNVKKSIAKIREGTYIWRGLC